jgi:hypothetical protein
MGCSSCGRRRHVNRDPRRRYKYLTTNQVVNRFKEFKKRYCISQLQCAEAEKCTLNNYKKCKKRKEVMELM